MKDMKDMKEIIKRTLGEVVEQELDDYSLELASVLYLDNITPDELREVRRRVRGWVAAADKVLGE